MRSPFFQVNFFMLCCLQLKLTCCRYESAVNGFSEGGFGGGGCGYLSAFGGGGGYTGGGGGSSQGYSGGGGSFIKFTGGREEGEVANDQDGYVTITAVGRQE